MTAAIYARKSTEQNGISDDEKSVARQIEHARTYAARKGWTVDERHVYVDDGISGAEFAARPGFVRLMAALKPKPTKTNGRPAVAPFQFLIMSEESRLGREQIETAYALKQIVQAGVRLFFYMGDRERTLDSPTDKIMLQLTAFSDELEREKARQRTYDAMLRKARAGHVTGGRVFGYDNVRTDRGHVERRINEAEAAIVRRIFELCAKGFGQIAIAKKLNGERAPAPRAQQGRPHAWAPSSVREVLQRELYRGELVWNRSRKRDVWGQTAARSRPEAEWIRVTVPKLRIIPETLWKTAHARLEATREAYLRTTGGKLWGRPLDGSARKYMLTGLARCGRCGGSLEVRSRSHGKQREYYYSCSSYWRRGKTVCPNKLEIPLRGADDAVVAALEQELLTPALVDMVVRKVLTRPMLAGRVLEDRRAALQTELGEVRGELARLVEALAKTGPSPAVTSAVKAREARAAHVEGELTALERREKVSTVELSRLEAIARQKASDWRSLLRRHTPQARQLLSKVCRDKLVFTPEHRRGRRGYRFTAEASILPLLTGLVPEFSQAMASPTGFEPVFWP